MRVAERKMRMYKRKQTIQYFGKGCFQGSHTKTKLQLKTWKKNFSKKFVCTNDCSRFFVHLYKRRDLIVLHFYRDHYQKTAPTLSLYWYWNKKKKKRKNIAQNTVFSCIKWRILVADCIWWQICNSCAKPS